MSGLIDRCDEKAPEYRDISSKCEGLDQMGVQVVVFPVQRNQGPVPSCVLPKKKLDFVIDDSFCVEETPLLFFPYLSRRHLTHDVLKNLRGDLSTSLGAFFSTAPWQDSDHDF